MERTHWARVGRPVVLAIGAMLALATGSDAKLSSTLAPATAHIGDVVTLTTAPDSAGVSQGGQPVPVYLLPGTTDPDNTACQQTGARLLGALAWDAAGVGTLSFRVPAVTLGKHVVAVLAPNAQPGCWPEATLTILAAAPPATDTSGPVSDSPEPGPLAVCLLAGIAGAALLRRRVDRPTAPTR